jgi:hypothetical protein
LLCVCRPLQPESVSATAAERVKKRFLRFIGPHERIG